jgi:hypothetical protein
MTVISAHNDVLFALIYDPLEETLPNAGRLVMAEGKLQLEVNTSNGNDTGSQVLPIRAAEIARDKKITIHTVAVGDPTAAGE